jgi:hypothetical protein
MSQTIYQMYSMYNFSHLFDSIQKECSREQDKYYHQRMKL